MKTAITFFLAILLHLPFALAGSKDVLNNPSSKGKVSSTPTRATELSQSLRNKALLIKSKFFHAKSSLLDYAALKTSTEYETYLRIADELSTIRLDELKTADEKIAFWINVYNALVVHGVVAYQVRDSVLSMPDFFSKTAYTIGGHRFNLDDIEHGILRGNKQTRTWTPFSKSDPRLRYSLTAKEVDPRIHMALNCGGKSCPPFSFYDPKELDTQLESATKGFILSESEVKKDAIYVSKIFDWYWSDFKPDLRSFLYAHSDGQLRAALEKNKPIQFKEYDWSINAKQ